MSLQVFLRLILTPALIVGLGLSSAHAIYKYKDENGRWVYSDTPKGQSSVISKPRKDPPAAQPVRSTGGLARIVELKGLIAGKHGTPVEFRSPTSESQENASGYTAKGHMVIDYPQVITLLEVIERRLDKYPEGFLNSIGMDRFVVARKLESPRLASVAGWADCNAKTMFLDFEASPSSLQRTLDHEIFHFFDCQTMGNQMRTEPAWLALNARGFSYSLKHFGSMRGGSFRRTGNSWESVPGFVSRYAMVNAAEDKAETYEMIISPGEREHAFALAAKDPIVAKKIALIVQRIQKHSPGFLPGLDPRFSQFIR
ncbi:MAG: DUF4124 domain-containing protein [Gammaproteobacteria bacterium]